MYHCVKLFCYLSQIALNLSIEQANALSLRNICQIWYKISLLTSLNDVSGTWHFSSYKGTIHFTATPQTTPCTNWSIIISFSFLIKGIFRLKPRKSISVSQLEQLGYYARYGIICGWSYNIMLILWKGPEQFEMLFFLNDQFIRVLEVCFHFFLNGNKDVHFWNRSEVIN